jgi:hypothetical protein
MAAQHQETRGLFVKRDVQPPIRFVDIAKTGV